MLEKKFLKMIFYFNSFLLHTRILIIINYSYNFAPKGQFALTQILCINKTSNSFCGKRKLVTKALI